MVVTHGIIGQEETIPQTRRSVGLEKDNLEDPSEGNEWSDREPPKTKPKLSSIDPASCRSKDADVDVFQV